MTLANLVMASLPLPAQSGTTEKVTLPAFEVTAVREGAPWEYATVENVEVLTLCSRSFTREFVEALLRARELMPREFLAEWSTPLAVVLIDLNAAKLKVAPDAVQARPGLSRLGHGWRGPTGFSTHTDGDTLLTVAALQDEPSIGRLAFAWVAKSFEAATPRHAAWLHEGLFGERGLFAELGRYPGEDRMRAASLLWVDESHTQALKGRNAPDPELLPWSTFFNQSAPDPIREPIEFARWQSQAGLFCRWALLAPKVRPLDAQSFWRWAHQSGRQVMSEDDFHRALGRDFTELTREIMPYLREAVRAPQDFSVPGLHVRKSPPKWKFRAATESEIARLKGNFERLEARRWQADRPERAAAYFDAAQRTLTRGLRMAPEDAALHGLLGLLKFENGQPAEAREHLEQAFAHGAASTRPLLALARLRLDGALRAGSSLSAHALGHVLEVLFEARARKPALPEVYEMITEAWEHSAAKPNQHHLAVLLEGVELFPEHTGLRLRAVALHRRHGFADLAAQIEAEAPHD
jgi:hypothetical protein